MGKILELVPQATKNSFSNSNDCITMKERK
jgi:hypothetical protein